jgi:hypothetical protein
MKKPLLTLPLFAALVLAANPTKSEIFRRQDEVLPPPVVPDVPVPSPIAPSLSDRVIRQWSTPAKIAPVKRPHVTYRNHPLHRKHHLACLPTHQVLLHVKDPVRCCTVEVPLCLPACCDASCMANRTGLMGRGVVCYDWDCGVRVKIVFRHKGDVLVHYYGI